MPSDSKHLSGLGKESIVPDEIKKWNWGAFFLNWIWGIGNSTYIALLMFVPIINLFIPFVLGAKGNKWAWQKRTWRDVEHFKKTQKKWAIAGLIFWFIFIPSLILLLSGMMKTNDAYKESLAIIQQNESVIEIIGTPVKSGFFIGGSIETNGASGKAELSYKIIGPKGDGVTYVVAKKEFGKWQIVTLITDFEIMDKRINIISSP